jgi:hypothetical protein
MHEFNLNQFSLGDIRDLITNLLTQGGDNLTEEQRDALTRRQSQVEQLERRGTAHDVNEEKDSLFEDILRIAGPVLIGYAIRALQDRWQQRDQPSGGSQGTTPTPRMPSQPQYGTYREGDATHRSTAGGQSVEEDE